MGRKKSAAALLLVLVVSMLAACGRKEYVVEYGVDGHVYLSRMVCGEKLIEDMKLIGDHLYYTQYIDDGTAVKRLSAAALASGEGELDFSQTEIPVVFWTNTFELPEGVGEKGEDIDFLALAADASKNNVVDERKKYGRLQLMEYAVSGEGDIYCYLSAFMGEYYRMENCGGVLCRQTPEGEQAFKLYMPEVLALAVNGDGKLFVLTGNEIQVLDRDGNRLGAVSTEGYHTDGKPPKEDLFADSEGRIYYTVLNKTHVRTTYEVTGENSFRLKNAGGFLGEGYMNYAAAPDGNIYRFGGGEDSLYEYDRKSGKGRKVLKWGDSDLMNDNILSVAGVTQDILLVLYVDGPLAEESGIYQLTKTPVDELPKKELLVIASPLNSPNLQKAVTSFNASNDSYRVIVDSYGAEYSDEKKRWESLQLDASLVSADPPDILDLEAFNIPKYAGKGILEDLSPYIEQSGMEKEDIPGNLLEGLTFDGKFVCIPFSFYVRGVAVRASQVKDLNSWTMEDLYRLTDEHPESIGGLVDSGYGVRAQSDWFLGEFCVPYYLEEFVDWESWECGFDNDDFRRLIEWVGKYKWTPEHVEEQTGVTVRYAIDIPEEVLLVSQSWLDFYSLARLEKQFGEKVCLLGYPSSDGGGSFPARISGGLGINAGSPDKEAAWEFLEHYLEVNSDTELYAGVRASKAKIKEEYEKETNSRTSGVGSFTEYPAVPKEQADAILNAIETADFRPLSDAQEMIAKIVVEEAQGYYQGDKSMDQAIRLIQNRVQLLLNELKP